MSAACTDLAAHNPHRTNTTMPVTDHHRMDREAAEWLFWARGSVSMIFL
jgi:hypothetical protein